MKNLVYFASGPAREEYQVLDFDRIFLVDNCFRDEWRRKDVVFTDRKVTCIGMDCLKSISYLKNGGVKIDCFVSLNEGLYEGGGRYAINSDMFLGYAMPLFNETYIHIMNKHYYFNKYKVSMDLPYEMEEIHHGDSRYLDPFIFSKEDYHKEHAQVFQMSKMHHIETYLIRPNLKLSIIHDSIWNYYDDLDLLAISIVDQGQSDFFSLIPKTVNVNEIRLTEIFAECNRSKIAKIGFTPWAFGRYIPLIKSLELSDMRYPEEIFLYHLNKNDYKKIKDAYSNQRIN